MTVSMTSTPHKLSLWTVTLININIMFGTGLFINTLMLAQKTGFLGFVSYIAVAILIIPLILSFSALLQRYPGGNFYTYSATAISPLVGFMSAWAYFIAKLASAALLIHVFSTLIATVISSLNIINPFMLDTIILTLFTLLNFFHMKTGRAVMYTFLFLKLVPILFVIFSCLYLYQSWSIPAQTLLWSGIPNTIPLVLYAFTGFEACCSLSNTLKNPAKDGPRALFISFCSVVTLTIIYQLLFFTALGTLLMKQANSFLHVLPPLLMTLWPSHPAIAHHVGKILYIALATASLGGSYGILFSNQWNLYTLAQQGHTAWRSYLTTLNRYHIPMLCIALEAILCLSYLLILKGNIILLQQMSVFGCTITFALSMLALLTAARASQHSYHTGIAIAGLVSCSLFFVLSIKNFILYGMGSFSVFIALFIGGLCMFWKQSKKIS